MRLLKVILCLLFSFCLTKVQAQEIEKLNLGISVNPQYAIPQKSDLSWFEPHNSFAINVLSDIEYELNSNFKIYSGLGLSLINIMLTDYSISTACGPNPFEGSMEDNYFEDNYYSNSALIPLGISTRLIGRKNRLNVKIGLDSYIHFHSTGISTFYECGTSWTPQKMDRPAMKRFYFFFKGALTYVHTLKENRQLYVEPNFSYSINPVSETIKFSTSDFAASKYLLLGVKVGYMWNVGKILSN